MNAGMKTSISQEWETPGVILELAKNLIGVAHFTLDVCATKENKKTARYFRREQDGLNKDWGRNTVWMNPPYGRQIGKWVEKAHRAAQRGATVVALLPARTDTKWFHDHVLSLYGMRCDRLLFLQGRVEFHRPDHEGRSQAPFPSMLVIWTPARKIGLTR